jgi:hypothetical protein
MRKAKPLVSLRYPEMALLVTHEPSSFHTLKYHSGECCRRESNRAPDMVFFGFLESEVALQPGLSFLRPNARAWPHGVDSVQSEGQMQVTYK